MSTYDRMLQLLPWGPLSRDDGALHLEELDAWADSIDGVDDQVALSVDACFPQTDPELLDRWEALLDLHPAAGDSDAVRQQRVLEALARVPLMTPAYIAAQLEILTTVEPTIVEFMAFHCDDAGSRVDYECLEKQWFFLAAFGRAAAVAASVDDELVEEQALLDRLKPGHTQGVACFDDFRCNDPYSLTDRDLLGA